MPKSSQNEMQILEEEKSEQTKKTEEEPRILNINTDQGTI